jgi:hypothetical protein
MKKLFAYAAIALFGTGALILATHSDAKSGSFKGKSWVFAKPHPHAKHHFAHAHAFNHRHRFARRLEFGFPGVVLGAPYAEPLIVEVPQETDDVTGSTGPRRVSVWHGHGPACSTENVTVPSSQGGETTVHVIRC